MMMKTIYPTHFTFKFKYIFFWICLQLFIVSAGAQNKKNVYTIYKLGNHKAFKIKSGTHITLFSKDNGDSNTALKVKQYVHGANTSFTREENDSVNLNMPTFTHYMHGPLVEINDKYLVIDCVKEQVNFSFGDTIHSIIKTPKNSESYFRTQVPLYQVEHLHAEVKSTHLVRNLAIISAVTLLAVAPVNAFTSAEADNIQTYRSLAIPGLLGCIVFIPLYYKLEYRNFSVHQ